MVFSSPVCVGRGGGGEGGIAGVRAEGVERRAYCLLLTPQSPLPTHPFCPLIGSNRGLKKNATAGAYGS